MATPKSRRSSVALAYNNAAPGLQDACKGRDQIAETIIKRARAAGLYVHDSAPLVALLMQVDLDSRIPREMYVAAAEVLAWLYQAEVGLNVAEGEKQDVKYPPVSGFPHEPE